jgi:hypothetical protein
MHFSFTFFCFVIELKEKNEGFFLILEMSTVDSNVLERPSTTKEDGLVQLSKSYH